MKKKAKAVPSAVSKYMAQIARKSHEVLKGTETARSRASKAAKARWAKFRAEKAKKASDDEADNISQKKQNTKL